MMKYHGVLIKVNIHQHVYNYFVTKERGDVDIKGKVYYTYVGYENDN